MIGWNRIIKLKIEIIIITQSETRFEFILKNDLIKI